MADDDTSNEHLPHQRHVTSTSSEEECSSQASSMDITEDVLHRTQSITDVTAIDTMCVKPSVPKESIQDSAHRESGASSELTARKDKMNTPEVGSTTRKSPTVSPQRAATSGVGDREIAAASGEGAEAEKEQRNTTPLASSSRTPMRLITLPARILITPPSSMDLKVHEVFNKSPRTIHPQVSPALSPVKDRADNETVVAVETDSPYSPTRDTCQKKRNDNEATISAHREKLLFSCSEKREADADLEKDGNPRKAKANQEQDAAKFNPKISNERSPKTEGLHTTQSMPSEHGENSQPHDATFAADNSDSHGSMEEINLHDDSSCQEEENMEPSNLKSSQLNNETRRSEQIRGARKFAINILKVSVLKGMTAQGARLKEVVNHKLKADKLATAVTGPKNATMVAKDGVPNQTVDNQSAFAINMQNMAEYLKATEKNMAGKCHFADAVNKVRSKLDQASQRLAAVKEPETSASTVQPTDPYFKPPVPSRPPRTEYNDPNRHTTIDRQEYRGPLVHTTISQSPGPLRGYTTSYPPNYGIPVPPSLPPPPPVPVENYFASKYCSGQCPGAQPLAPPSQGQHGPIFHQGASPVVFVADSARTDRPRHEFPWSQLNPKTRRYPGIVKQAPPVFVASQGSSLTETITEERFSQRPNVDSDSDRFRYHDDHLFSGDDLLKVAVCCCCWPVGLAARMFTIMVPDHDGPVDACIKSMSRQMSSLALVLGIATYFVFFVLWMSLLVVAGRMN